MNSPSSGRADAAPPAVRIPVSEPLLGEAEARYVQDAVARGEISGLSGEYVPRFEEVFARYVGRGHAVTTSSGTAALHLALAALSIGPGDEVLVSTLTNMATFFAVLYQGARPVPVDVEPDTWNMDPALLESLITPRTRAILVVHCFGHPADMDPILEVARRHRLRVVEDCAHAHGATYKGRKAGSLGDLGCFSFYANKIITTGEGGMVVSDDPELAARVRSLKNMAWGDACKFMHREIGYNYRMSNLQAAVGCAQMEKIELILSKKREIARRYREGLSDLPALRLPVERPWAGHSYWMYHVMLRAGGAARRAAVMAALAQRGIETRECFVPYNMQEIFIRQGATRLEDCPRADEAARCGFYLPTGAPLAPDAQGYVVEQLRLLLS